MKVSLSSHHRGVNSTESERNEGQCFPVSRIVFIKTHKTASSTTSSIIERYGYLHNLSFVVRPEGQILTETALFHRSVVGKHNKHKTSENCSGSFDILAHHARYNRPEMEAVVPDATYVTIIRDPVSQFESAFAYYDIAKKLGLSRYDNPLAEFMKKPRTYFNMRTFDYYWQILRNSQIYDLGLNHADHDNECVVDSKISTLERELDLVMLTEYFPESLILLKKLLCWDFEDILYVSNRVRSSKYRVDLPTDLKDKIRQWNSADRKLYEHFNKTFWRRVKEYGPEFSKDLAIFRRKQLEVREECIDVNSTESGSLEMVYNLKANASRLCLAVLRDDRVYTTLIQDRMRENGEASPKFSLGYLRDYFRSFVHS